MKKTLLFSVFVVALLTSCSKSKNPENLIPKEAKFAMVINLPEILKKLKEGGIEVSKNETIMMRSLLDSTFKPTANFWNELPDTGLDTTKSMVMSVAESPNSGITKKMAVYAVLAMGNKNKFEKYLQKNIGKNLAIEKGGLSFIGDDETMLGYNSSYIIMASEKELDKGSRSSGFRMRNENEAETSKQLIKELIRTGKSNSLASVKSFKQLSNKFDVKMWGDLEFIKDNLPKDEGESLQFITRIFGDMFTGTTIGSVINFEKGKMQMTNSISFSDEMTKVFDASPTKPVDLSLLNGYQGDTLYQMAVTSFSPVFLKNYVEHFKLQTLLAGALDKSGITEKEIYNMFGGSAISVSADLKMGQNPNLSNSGYILSINDRAAVEKTLPILLGEKLQKIDNLLAMQTSPENSYLGMPAQYSYIGINDKAMIITPNKALAQAYVAGTGKNSFASSEMYKFVNGKKGAGIASSELFKLAFSGLGTLSSQFGMVSGVLNNMTMPITNYSYVSGDFKNNTLETSITVNTDNSKVNFLPYIIKKSFQMAQSASRNYRDEFEPDDATPMDKYKYMEKSDVQEAPAYSR